MGATSSTYAKTRYTVEAKRWKAHDSFTAGFTENDIGIVYLPQNVHKNENTALGYLYLNDPTDSGSFDTFYLNKIATVAGWGSVDGSVDVYTDKLQYTTVKIITQDECDSAFGAAFTAKVICTVSPTTVTRQVSTENMT